MNRFLLSLTIVVTSGSAALDVQILGNLNFGVVHSSGSDSTNADLCISGDPGQYQITLTGANNGPFILNASGTSVPLTVYWSSSSGIFGGFPVSPGQVIHYDLPFQQIPMQGCQIPNANIKLELNNLNLLEIPAGSASGDIEITISEAFIQ